MASTYSFNDALAIVSPQFKNKVDTSLAVHAVNIALNAMWMAYDWRETIATLPPFWLSPNDQDFGKPLYAVPADFAGLRETYLVSLQSYNNWTTPVNVQSNLEFTQLVGPTEAICYHPATSSFRLWPRVPANMGAPNWLINGSYKKKPIKLTSTTMTGALIPWDDIWFQVFVIALQWAFMVVSGDPRAGQVISVGGRFQASGQAAILKEALDNMASSEGLNLGDPAIAPSEPLVGW